MNASPDNATGGTGSPGPAMELPARLGTAAAIPTPGELDATWLCHQRLVTLTVDAIDAAVDAKDWNAARALFADRVAVDVRSLGGPAADLASADLVGGWATSLAEPKTSLHLRTNHRVRFSEQQTRAVVESHGYA